MARLPRVIEVGKPHHVIQRGNRRQNVFFKPQDKNEYLRILELNAKFFKLKIWAYCLMDNHVHLIVVPEERESLTKAIGETHQLYTRMINFREGWRGYLWQGRFKSIPLNEKYLFTAVRYVEQNPVRAGIVKKAIQYPWSSAKPHITKEKNHILHHFYLIDEIKNWVAYLSSPEDQKEITLIRKHSEAGRPFCQE